VPLASPSRLSRPLRLSRLFRSPFAFWLAVAGLALTTSLVVAQAVGRANALAGHYGPLRPVVVAAHPVDRGTEVKAADLTVRRVPARFRTDGSFDSAGQVEGRVTVVPLVTGEPVLRAHLAPDGLAGITALLPPGTRAVAVPTGSASPPLRTGDVVDLLATFEDDPALAIALDAPVVDVGPDAATVAVSPTEARAVALAISRGAVTVALTPGVSVRR
jgi:Flp pilus assembly protein CpaB